MTHILHMVIRVPSPRAEMYNHGGREERSAKCIVFRKPLGGIVWAPTLLSMIYFVFRTLLHDQYTIIYLRSQGFSILYVYWNSSCVNSRLRVDLDPFTRIHNTVTVPLVRNVDGERSEGCCHLANGSFYFVANCCHLANRL